MLLTIVSNLHNFPRFTFNRDLKLYSKTFTFVTSIQIAVFIKGIFIQVVFTCKTSSYTYKSHPNIVFKSWNEDTLFQIKKV